MELIWLKEKGFKFKVQPRVAWLLTAPVFAYLAPELVPAIKAAFVAAGG